MLAVGVPTGIPFVAKVSTLRAPAKAVLDLFALQARASGATTINVTGYANSARYREGA